MSKKSTSQSGPSKFAQPFIRQGANALQNAYNAQMPAIQQQTDNVLGNLNPWLEQRLNEGNAGVNAAQQYGLDVLSGQYLHSNPYFDEVVNNTLNDTVNNTQGALSLKGLTGGSSYADIISKNVGRQSSSMRSDQYNRERQAQEAAAGRAGQLASAEYLPVAPMLQTINASTIPFQQAQGYAQSLGGLLGGYQSQTQSQPLLGQLLGAGAQVGSAALLASDPSVKHSVEQIGALPNGLGVYEFNYIWDEADADKHVGVMADEVENVIPDAVHVVDGVKHVDYSMIDMGGFA